MEEKSTTSPCMVFDMPNCGGCRTCEIACSFHHTNEFNPSISSINILEIKNKAGYQISFAVHDIGKRIACDGCRDNEVPLCVQY
jgi:Fe-S-cluster-containing dehydrogenase component